MIWNGYFSITKEHSYKLQDIMLIPGLYSFDVLKGRGVCLAYSELLYNYLTTCGKTASLLDCEVPTSKKNISYDYKAPIERKNGTNKKHKVLYDIATPLAKPIVSNIGNHAVNLIEDNGRMYIYDSTNLFILNIIDSKTAHIINGSGQFIIKPINTLMLHPSSDENHLFEKLIRGEVGDPLTRKEVIFSFENIIEILNNNKSLLEIHMPKYIHISNISVKKQINIKKKSIT